MAEYFAALRPGFPPPALSDRQQRNPGARRIVGQKRRPATRHPRLFRMPWTDARRYGAGDPGFARPARQLASAPSSAPGAMAREPPPRPTACRSSRAHSPKTRAVAAFSRHGRRRRIRRLHRAGSLAMPLRAAASRTERKSCLCREPCQFPLPALAVSLLVGAMPAMAQDAALIAKGEQPRLRWRLHRLPHRARRQDLCRRTADEDAVRHALYVEHHTRSADRNRNSGRPISSTR